MDPEFNVDTGWTSPKHLQAANGKSIILNDVYVSLRQMSRVTAVGL
jgi:hypothetical protein